MNRLLHSYQRILGKHPVGVNIAQTCFLMGLGDCVAQVAIEKRTLKNFNFRRTLEFASLGALLVGPALTIWYRTLAWKFGNENTLKIGATKMLCDQLLFAPNFLAIFITSADLIQGKSWEESKQQIREKYFDILMANYTLWPLFQIVNFSMVPLNYQVLTVQIVSLFWNTYLSWKTRN